MGIGNKVSMTSEVMTIENKLGGKLEIQKDKDTPLFHLHAKAIVSKATNQVHNNDTKKLEIDINDAHELWTIA